MKAITFAKGNEQHLKDCKDALCQSTLGKKYFSSPGSVENAILEGIRQGNLYVALIGEECVGFTYIIPKGAFHSFPYLHIIAIKEEYRGFGVGKALLDYSERIASEMADKFSLWSRIIIRKQSASTKEMAISRLEKFQTCTVPESRNT